MSVTKLPVRVEDIFSCLEYKGSPLRPCAWVKEALKHCLTLWKSSRHNCRSLLIILVSEPIKNGFGKHVNRSECLSNSYVAIDTEIGEIWREIVFNTGPQCG